MTRHLDLPDPGNLSGGVSELSCNHLYGEPGSNSAVKSPDVLGIIDRVWFGKRKRRIWDNSAGYGRKSRDWGEERKQR